MDNLDKDTFITHGTASDVPYTEVTEEILKQTEKRLMKSKDLILPIDETLSLLKDLSEFTLGRFLLHNKGLNGFWTSFILQDPETVVSPHPLEWWMLNKSLLVLIRKRFAIFQREITKRLHSNMSIASIPCGLMDDLLTLDYSGLRDIHLVGIDIDEESLELARKNAHKHDLQQNLVLLHKDAWSLNLINEYDLIVSNGLNMYESDENRLIELYENFNKALKPEGALIISFIPPPPGENNKECTWDSFNIDEEDLKIEQSIFIDILQVKYLNFCSERKMRSQLESANFRVHEVIYTYKGVAPVVVAVKK